MNEFLNGISELTVDKQSSQLIFIVQWQMQFNLNQYVSLVFVSSTQL